MHHLPEHSFIKPVKAEGFINSWPGLSWRRFSLVWQTSPLKQSAQQAAPRSHFQPAPAGASPSHTQADCQDLAHQMLIYHAAPWEVMAQTQTPALPCRLPLPCSWSCLTGSEHCAHAHTASAARPLLHLSCRAGSSTCMPHLVHAPSRWLLNRDTGWGWGERLKFSTLPGLNCWVTEAADILQNKQLATSVKIILLGHSWDSVDPCSLFRLSEKQIHACIVMDISNNMLFHKLNEKWLWN